MTRILIIILLCIAAAVACCLQGCSGPALEVTAAHGIGRVEGTIAGEPFAVQVETQTIDGEDARAETVCPSYDVSVGSARVSGLSPGSPSECASLGVVEREATWQRLSGPLILTIFEIISSFAS
jgi:hypothetical protein